MDSGSNSVAKKKQEKNKYATEVHEALKKPLPTPYYCGSAYHDGPPKTGSTAPGLQETEHVCSLTNKIHQIQRKSQDGQS